MMGNRKEPGFRATNVELTTVRSVERGIINLDDGRSVPANYREFTRGYIKSMMYRLMERAMFWELVPLARNPTG
jgi:hypothetical protein